MLQCTNRLLILPIARIQSNCGRWLNLLLTQNPRAICPDRWEVGPYFAHHLASCTPLHPYVTLHFEVERESRFSAKMCKRSAYFQKCRWSRKEGHSKCYTSSALPDDMGGHQVTLIVHVSDNLIFSIINIPQAKLAPPCGHTSTWILGWHQI